MFTLFIEDQNGRVADEYSFEGGEFIVGRSRDCDIVLPGENVSRKHARVFTRGNQCFVYDYGSTNGIILNGKRIHGESLLDVPAQIKIGDFCIHIESESLGDDNNQSGYAILHGINLGLAGRTYKITDTVALVGRGRDCPTTIIDPSVSRVHAKFTADEDGTLFLEDLKSANGTFVNGQTISRVSLQSGDRIRFGNVELDVELLKQAVSSPKRRGFTWGHFGQHDSSMTWLSITAIILLLVSITAGGAIFWDDLDRLWGNEGKQTKSYPTQNSTPPAEKNGPALDTKPPEALKVTNKTMVGTSSSNALSEVERATLRAEGLDCTADRRWVQAETVYRKLLQADPLSTAHQTALNNVIVEKRNAFLLKSALNDNAAKHHGDALRGLFQVTAESVYFLEAQKEIHELLGMKVASAERARKECEKRRWKSCYELYGAANIIDRDDQHLQALRAKIQEKINL